MNTVRLLSMYFAFSSFVFCGQIGNDINTEGPRALDEALQSIENSFHAPLFYEEIPHENEADLVSGSALGMNPNFHYLKWRKLDVVIVKPSTIESAVNDTLVTCLNDLVTLRSWYAPEWCATLWRIAEG